MRAFLAILVSVSVMLIGCASINPTDKYPVISKTFGPNKLSDVGEAIAITSDRRVVIVMVKPPRGEQSAGEWGRFCAEPPPDTAMELSRILTANMQANAALRPDSPASGSAGFTSSDIQTAHTLFERSQGEQMFRDGLYSLCQLYANGALRADEVAPLFNTLLTRTANSVDHVISVEPVGKK